MKQEKEHNSIRINWQENRKRKWNTTQSGSSVTLRINSTFNNCNDSILKPNECHFIPNGLPFSTAMINSYCVACHFLFNLRHKLTKPQYPADEQILSIRTITLTCHSSTSSLAWTATVSFTPQRFYDLRVPIFGCLCNNHWCRIR